jgi:hypothetical protein
MTKYTIGVATIDGGKEVDCTQKDIDDIEARKASRAKEVEAFKKTQYQLDRKAEYLSIGDQLDMQYKDLINGTTTWKDHVAKVKSDNPKG